MNIETATFKAYNREQESKHIFYVKNAHGDVIGKIDEQGNLLSSYAYNAFGELVTSADFTPEQSQNITRFLYAGEQYDETSGLYYLRARNYDAGAGRFTQEDTYLGDGRNLYAYVHSNPLKYVDPSGHASEEQFDNDGDTNDWLDKATEGGYGQMTNPYGRSGGLAHQNTIAAIQPGSIGGEMRYEVKYITPVGEKSCRYADAVEIANGEVVAIYQVGRQNKNGTPVAREVRAMNDIASSPQYNGAAMYFIPYN